jgi:hypothetical protein
VGFKETMICLDIRRTRVLTVLIVVPAKVWDKPYPTRILRGLCMGGSLILLLGLVPESEARNLLMKLTHLVIGEEVIEWF